MVMYKQTGELSEGRKGNSLVKALKSRKAPAQWVQKRLAPTSTSYSEQNEHQAEGEFLNLLADDIESHPERLIPTEEKWLSDLRELVGGVEVDSDELLPDDD